MGHVINSIHIDAPPERVFELITDAQRFPEWGDSVIEVKDVSGPQDRVGASFTAVMKFAGRRVESRFETTRVEKPTYLEQKGTMPGGGDSTAINRLEPAGGGTDAKVELDYELPGGFFGDLADRLFMERAIERGVKHNGDNLKAICEAGVHAHA
jgi:uncharacterized protein YndB with AHSA1/START domain